MNSSYIRTKFNNFINVSEIVTIHYYEFDNTFEFGGEKHNFWEIVYVDSGAVEIMRDNKRVILKQGEILFHQPNEFHTIKSYNSSPDVFVISFASKSSAMSYFANYNATLDKTLQPFISSIISEAENTYIMPKNDITLKKLITKDNAPIGGEQMIKTYLEQLLIILARDIFGKKDVVIFPSKESMETYIISEIKKYIKSKVTQKLKIEDICRHFGYSKTYLSQLFKTQCSISLINYYNKEKIEYSKKLIREQHFNMTQISDMLSFDNPQYFARVFKRVTGLTPSEYAKSLKVKGY